VFLRLSRPLCDFTFVFLSVALANAAGAQVQVPDVKRIANPSPAAAAAFGKGVVGIRDVNGDKTATAKQGQAANFTLTVTPQNGFNQAVSFGCGGLPTGASCSFSPVSVTPDGSPVSATLTVTTMAPSSHAALWGPKSYALIIQGSTIMAAMLLVPGVFRRKPHNRRSVLTGITLLLVIVLLSAGCAGGVSSTSTGVSGGTPVGIFQITVSSSAISGTPHHDIAVSINMTQ